MKTFYVIHLIVIYSTITTIQFIRRRQENVEKQQFTCGYESCPKSDPDKLNIHLVAHSHDDVGWLKTVDEYYYGERIDIQISCVRDIINSVVDALVKDSSRKFIYVETAYLWKWLTLESDEKIAIVKNLINEGLLEIIGGGWSMNDEATTHYQSIIDQYTWGFRRLSDTFGECARPKIGWQIDPFGHSREQASIFAQLGFDGFFVGRLDYQDKAQRFKNKNAEFVWEGSSSLGSSASIFTSVLYNLYNPPKGFCFDILCFSKDTIDDDPKSANYNFEQKVIDFLNYADRQSEKYQTNNIIVTMGGDFTYMRAERFYENLDKLIRGIEKFNGTKYKAFYSTPSCYLKALNNENLMWATKNDDFFPYASEPNTYWTGYFSSRPTLKFFERMGNNFLQVVKQLNVLTSTSDSEDLKHFREAMGVLQHHDAVTGTEQQHVADDYARILHENMKNGEKLVSDALQKWTVKKKPKKPTEFNSCLLLNISLCEYTVENSKFVVTVYNPTSQPLNTYIRLPVKGSRYNVQNFNGTKLLTQLVPVPISLLQIPGRVSDATQELIFKAINIAPLGYQSFYVTSESNNNVVKSNKSLSELLEIKNQHFRISVNDKNRILVQAPFGIEYEQSFQYYESAEGDNKNNNRSSGAYIFRPKNNYSKQFNNTDGFLVVKGPLVQEIHQIINNWVSQVIRIYNDENYVEFNWLIGPIPIDDNVGKEVITKYSSNLKSKNEFYTDSNGREMLKRKLNYRPTWNLKLNETISGNYYPVTVKAAIEDEIYGHRLSVLNDRAQGGSSLNEGEIELMIHRRILKDDDFGVREPLNETAYGVGLVARGQHILISGSLQNRDELILQEKEEAIKLSLRPWIFVSPTKYSFEEWNEHYSMKTEGVIEKLPRNIRILTLEPWRDGKVLLRLEHLFENHESSKYSVATTISKNDLFPNVDVLSIIETTLCANQRIEDNERLEWKSHGHGVPKNKIPSLRGSGNNFVISLKPMEIRTFLIKLSPVNNQPL